MADMTHPKSTQKIIDRLRKWPGSLIVYDPVERRASWQHSLAAEGFPVSRKALEDLQPLLVPDQGGIEPMIDCYTMKLAERGQ